MLFILSISSPVPPVPRAEVGSRKTEDQSDFRLPTLFCGSTIPLRTFTIAHDHDGHVCAAPTAARSFIRLGIGVTKAPADADAQAISDHEDGPPCSLEHGCWRSC